MIRFTLPFTCRALQGHLDILRGYGHVVDGEDCVAGLELLTLEGWVIQGASELVRLTNERLAQEMSGMWVSRGVWARNRIRWERSMKIEGLAPGPPTTSESIWHPLKRIPSVVCAAFASLWVEVGGAKTDTGAVSMSCSRLLCKLPHRTRQSCNDSAIVRPSTTLPAL